MCNFSLALLEVILEGEMCHMNMVLQIAECFHEKIQDYSADNLFKGPVTIANSQMAWLGFAGALEGQRVLKPFTCIVTE